MNITLVYPDNDITEVLKIHNKEAGRWQVENIYPYQNCDCII